MINTYLEYINTVSDASVTFARSAALALLSGISQRRVIITAMGAKHMYPNIWVMLLGASGISRKSTVIKPVNRILSNIYPSVILPDRMTEESTFAYFHKKGNAQAMLIADEFAGTLANLDKQYTMGYKQLLMNLYDCTDYERRTLKSSDEIIQDAYLTILAGGTPHGIMKYLSERDIESGFLPRFLIAYPPLPEPKRIPEKTPKTDFLFRKVSAEAFLYRVLLEHANIYAIYDKDAYQYISDFFFNREIEVRKNYSPALGSIYAREMEYSFKISTLFAIDELIETAISDRLDKLLRNIVYRTSKPYKDPDTDEPPEPVPSIYEYLMFFIDKNKTGENLALSFITLLKAFGDAFDKVPLDATYKDYRKIYEVISEYPSLLDAYQSGILSTFDVLKIPLRIQIEHAKKAVRFIQEREADALRLNREILGGHTRHITEKVYNYIKQRQPVSHSTVLRGLNMNKNDLKEAIQQLAEEERIKIERIGRRKIYLIDGETD